MMFTQGWAVAAVRDPRMLASVADRERTIKILQESFAEGRLTNAEFEQRVEQAILARDFGELLALTADLPRPLRETAGRTASLPALRISNGAVLGRAGNKNPRAR